MILTDSQQVTLSATFVDRAGNTVPAPDAGTLAWSSSDEAVVTVTDNGDGTALAVTTGTLGSVLITLTDDLDGDTVPEFLGSIAIDVVTGAVTGIVITPGAPTEKP